VRVIFVTGFDVAPVGPECWRVDWSKLSVPVRAGYLTLLREKRRRTHVAATGRWNATFCSVIFPVRSVATRDLYTVLRYDTIGADF